MLVNTIMALFVFSLSNFSWAQVWSAPYHIREGKEAPNCSAYQYKNEKDLISIIKKTSYRKNRTCLILDKVAENGLQTAMSLFEMVPLIEGIPADLIKVWKKLNWEKVQMVSTDQVLCLNEDSDDCNEDSALVAKNYIQGKKKGIIVINRNQWKSLKRAERFSIIWHEMLGILGYEKNSYQYSSMVTFSDECETTFNSNNSGSMDCSLVAKFYPGSF